MGTLKELQRRGICVFDESSSNVHRRTSFAQEIEVLALGATTMLSKYRKIATVDELLERLFFVGKAAVTVLLYFIGARHAAAYLLLWTGAFCTVSKNIFSVRTQSRGRSVIFCYCSELLVFTSSSSRWFHTTPTIKFKGNQIMYRSLGLVNLPPDK